MSEQEKNSRSAFTLLELILTICIIGIVVAILIPNRIDQHRTSPANACINNMRQIDAAANQFALENHKTNGEAISFPNDLTPYIKLNSQGKIPPCPSGGSYHIQRGGSIPICSLGYTVTPAHVLP